MATDNGGSYLRLYRCNDRSFDRSQTGANRIYIRRVGAEAQILCNTGEKYVYD